jgi:hypothetical protein
MSATPKPFLSLSLVRQALPSQGDIEALQRVVPERDQIPHAELEDSLRTIARRFANLPLKGLALDLYTNRRVTLLGNKETVKLPSVIPGWRVGGQNGRISAIVNAVPYVPAAGAAEMDARRLFGLLSVGAVLVSTYDAWGKLHASMTLAKAGGVVYARMMHKVADRITAAGTDRMRSDQLKYVFAKYFGIGMLGRSVGDTTDAIAATATLGTAKGALDQFEADLAAAANTEDQSALYALPLVDFLRALSGAAQWTSRITSRSFIQAFTSLYGPPSLLAAEDASYFLALLATHQAGAEMVSSFSLDPVYGKEGDDALDELMRLSR